MTVTVRGTDVGVGDVRDLIWVSETVSADALGNKLRDATAPAIIADAHVWKYFGMTAGDGALIPNRIVTIADPEHPLAAGLTGTFNVFDMTVTFNLIEPPPGAIAPVREFQSYAARDTGAIAKAAVFAYDKGATMGGGHKAPARRVGFFLRAHHDNATHFTAQGWRIFEAAVGWAAGKL